MSENNLASKISLIVFSCSKYYDIFKQIKLGPIYSQRNIKTTSVRA